MLCWTVQCKVYSVQASSWSGAISTHRPFRIHTYEETVGKGCRQKQLRVAPLLCRGSKSMEGRLCLTFQDTIYLVEDLAHHLQLNQRKHHVFLFLCFSNRTYVIKNDYNRGWRDDSSFRVFTALLGDLCSILNTHITWLTTPIPWHSYTSVNSVSTWIHVSIHRHTDTCTELELLKLNIIND